MVGVRIDPNDWQLPVTPAQIVLRTVERAIDTDPDTRGEVILLRVGEDDGVDFRRIKMREAAVDVVGLAAAALIEPAVEQDPAPVDFQQMLRTGGGARGTAEFEFHGECVASIAG